MELCSNDDEWTEDDDPPRANKHFLFWLSSRRKKRKKNEMLILSLLSALSTHYTDNLISTQPNTTTVIGQYIKQYLHTPYIITYHLYESYFSR